MSCQLNSGISKIIMVQHKATVSCEQQGQPTSFSGLPIVQILQYAYYKRSKLDGGKRLGNHSVDRLTASYVVIFSSHFGGG